MPKLAIPPATQVRIHCESGIRQLVKCRQLATKVSCLSHATHAKAKIHQAARISREIDQSVSRLRFALLKLLEEASEETHDTPLPDAIRPKSDAPGWVSSRVQTLASKSAGFIARSASRPIISTASVAVAGAKHSMLATVDFVKPRAVSIAHYVITPSASVGASAMAAGMQTAAEICRATGDTGAIRQALRDPAYAKELQRILNERQKQKQNGQMLDRISIWASVVNESAVARLSPRASRLVAGIGTRLNRVIRPNSVDASSGAQANINVDDVLSGRRSYLLESTRVTLFLNTWISTSLHQKVQLLASTSDNSVEYLVCVAGKVSEYRQLGWHDGSVAAYNDVISPAFAVVTSAGLSYSRLAFATAWSYARHPLSIFTPRSDGGVAPAA